MFNAMLYVITVLVWGTTWFAINFQLGHVPIEWSLIYRFALAAIILFGICFVTGRPLKFDRRDHALFAVLGLFLFSSNYYFSYLSVQYLTSGLVAVVFSSLTMMNIINAAIFLKKPLIPSVVGASLLGLTGIGFIFWPEIETFDLGGPAFVGAGIGTLAALLASFGNTVAATSRARALPLVQLNAWGIFYGTLLMVALTLASGIAPAYDTSLAYNLSLIYLATFGTVIAFLAFLSLIARVGPERAGYIGVGFPVVALMVSTVFEGFVWTDPALIGLALVLLGNVMILRIRKVPGR